MATQSCQLASAVKCYFNNKGTSSVFVFATAMDRGYTADQLMDAPFNLTEDHISAIQAYRKGVANKKAISLDLTHEQRVNAISALAAATNVPIPERFKAFTV